MTLKGCHLLKPSDSSSLELEGRISFVSMFRWSLRLGQYSKDPARSTRYGLMSHSKLNW